MPYGKNKVKSPIFILPPRWSVVEKVVWVSVRRRERSLLLDESRCILVAFQKQNGWSHHMRIKLGWHKYHLWLSSLLPFQWYKLILSPRIVLRKLHWRRAIIDGICFYLRPCSHNTGFISYRILENTGLPIWYENLPCSHKSGFSFKLCSHGSAYCLT